MHIVNDLNTGGAQTLIEALVRDSDGDYTVVCLSDRGELSQRVEKLAPVVYLGHRRSSRRLIHLLRQARRTLKDIDPDVVHSHLLHSDFVALAASVGRRWAKISTVHTTGFGSQDPLRSRLLGRIVGLASRQFDAVVACGPRARDYMRRSGFSDRNAHTVLNGVHVPKELAAGVAEPDKLLMLARWHPMKDHKTALRAVAAVRDRGLSVSLVLAGHEMVPSNNDLTDMLAQFNLDEVEAVGAVDDVSEFLRGARCLLISSAYGEALPMAGLEALAVGTPVITTNVGDCSQLVVRSWQMVEPGDADGLADALTQVLVSTPEEYGAMRVDSYARASAQFSIDRTRSSYHAIYSSSRGRR